MKKLLVACVLVGVVFSVGWQVGNTPVDRAINVLSNIRGATMPLPTANKWLGNMYAVYGQFALQRDLKDSNGDPVPGYTKGTIVPPSIDDNGTERPPLWSEMSNAEKGYWFLEFQYAFILDAQRGKIRRDASTVTEEAALEAELEADFDPSP